MKAVPLLPAASSWGALVALLLSAQIGESQQIQTSVAVGAAALRYADTLSTGTISVTPRLFGDWNAISLDASGSYSQFTSRGGGSSVQGAVSASRLFALTGTVAGELGGFAGGSSHNDGTRTGEMLANGRLHVGRAIGELFTGASVGRACYGGSCQRLVLGEVGGSFQAGPSSGIVSVSPAMVSDSLKYTDSQGTFTWNADRTEITAQLGHRFGDQLTALGTDTRTWASLTATRWIVPRIAVVGSGGTYPIDPTQGFPGGRFASLGVLINTGALRRNRSLGAEYPAEPGRLDDVVPRVVAFTAGRTQGGTVRFEATATGAKQVDIAGDFTGWEPVAMKEDPTHPGSWSVALPVQRGKYQMNIRINGDRWTVPPGLLPLSDEFGGNVGLLVVE